MWLTDLQRKYTIPDMNLQRKPLLEERPSLAAIHSRTMTAVVQDTYGSSTVLHLDEVEKPQIGDDDVLLRVHAASLNIGDWHYMAGLPLVFRISGVGLRAPK